MHLDYSADQQRLREEIRNYYKELFTPDLRARLDAEYEEMGGPVFREVVGRMGADGWLGIGWPKQHGGQGQGPIEQFIFFDEVRRAGFPVPILTLNTVGPTLLEFGSEAQKDEYLPRILAGKCHFSIGYSEPGAGTDLASLQTTATRDGDEYVIRGQKMWTSLADYADYIWLAARTNPEASKHRGISMFLVPTDAPGFKISPITTLGGVRTNATFYEDVRVPEENLIGGEDNGWSLITGQLNHERVSLMNVGAIRRLLGDTTEWARTTDAGNGSKVVDEPWVQSHLARVKAKIEVLRLMNWKQAWALTQGSLHPADSSTIKVFGSELFIEAYRRLLEILGHRATLLDGSPGAVLRGRVNASYRNGLILTFGGGTNEVQRDIIAMAGLQMPHYKN